MEKESKVEPLIDEKMMETKHFCIYTTQIPGQYEIRLMGKKLLIDNNDVLMLLQKDAFYVPIEELRFIPYRIGIANELKDINGSEENIIDLEPHVTKIRYYYPGRAIVSFLIWDPRIDNGYFDRSSEGFFEASQDYKMELYNIVSTDGNFTLMFNSQIYQRVDIDKQILAEIPHLKYIHRNPFEFTTQFHAETFGELALKVQKMSQELDQKATKAVQIKRRLK